MYDKWFLVQTYWLNKVNNPYWLKLQNKVGLLQSIWLFIYILLVLLSNFALCVCDALLIRLMRSDGEGNWEVNSDTTLPSGRRRRLYINICRPVLPITCESCTNACAQNAAVCAVDFVRSKVVYYSVFFQICNHINLLSFLSHHCTVCCDTKTVWICAVFLASSIIS